MARDRVITGEAVELELPVARLATRTASALVDGVVDIILLIVLSTAASFVLEAIHADLALEGAVYTVITLLALLIWPVTFETVTRGRSPGKFVLGLRVVREDGGPIRFRHALVRGLVALGIECPGLLMLPLTWALGLWTMLLSRNARRIGDLAAGTMVLQERLPERGRYVAPMPPALQPWAASLDLTRVSDELALTARQFLARAHELREGPRAALGQRLVDEISAVTTPPPPPRTPGWWYLAAVVAERRRRHEERLAAQRRQYVQSGATGGIVTGTLPPPVYAPLPGQPAARPLQSPQLDPHPMHGERAGVQTGPAGPASAEPAAGYLPPV